MSSATMTATVVLENPRHLDKHGKTIVVDGQIYLGEGQAPLTAALRFFNGTDMKFDDMGIYFLHTTVSCIFDV